MLDQAVINWALGAATGIVGALVGYLIRTDKELAEKVHALAIIVAGMQQAQQDTLAFRQEMRDQLRYIIARLDKEST